MPPSIKGAFSGGPDEFFRWKGGRVTECVNSPYATGLDLSSVQYRTATIFLTVPSFHEAPLRVLFIAAACNAQTSAVTESSLPGWRQLCFRETLIEDDSSKACFSHIFLGDGMYTEKLGYIKQANWKSQLLPEFYEIGDWSSRGLTGQLPLLLALAAFSAPEARLVSVMTESLRLGEWRPHQYENPCMPIP